MIGLEHFAILSALLFCLGLAGALMRRHVIIVLIGIEIMLNAANLNFIAFWRYGPNPEALSGPLFALFAIAVAAAEVAIPHYCGERFDARFDIILLAPGRWPRHLTNVWHAGQ